MDTTLPLDEDVVALLERVKAEVPGNVQQLVSDILRAGLKKRVSKPLEEKSQTYQMQVSDSEILIKNIDNIEEVLDQLEGPWRR